MGISDLIYEFRLKGRENPIHIDIENRIRRLTGHPEVITLLGLKKSLNEGGAEMDRIIDLVESMRRDIRAHMRVDDDLL